LGRLKFPRDKFFSAFHEELAGHKREFQSINFSYQLVSPFV
jgi:hypothetical protein